MKGTALMCYMIAVGKKASADGSTMVARNCDANSTEAQRIISVPRMKHKLPKGIRIPDSNNVVVPQVGETYAFTAITRMVDGDDIGMVAGGINEFQLSAGASTGGWLKKEVEEASPIPEKVVGDYRMQLILERCRTAREAIDWLGANVAEYGARTDNYIVADPEEVWFYEEYQDYQWAAVRVPDDCFVVEANSFRIGLIDPNDTENCKCSPNLISFAIEHGFYDPKDGPFYASRVYGTNDRNRPRGLKVDENNQPYYSLHRIWRGIELLSGLKLDPYEPTKEYPLFVKPAHPLKPEDLINVLKDYYEGTDLDEYAPAFADNNTSIVDPFTGHYKLSPAWCKSRIIGCPQTITSWVTQSRSWLPNGIGGIIWAGLAAAAASPHIPFYACNKYTPQAYQIGDSGNNSKYTEGSAYWLFENIGNIMNLFYQGTVDLVKPVWADFDRKNYEAQAGIEPAAMDMYKEDPKKAAAFLTDYSNGIALNALEVGKQILADEFLRLAMVNNPQTSRGYEDPKTWLGSGLIY